MNAAPHETAAQIRDLLAMYRRTHYRVTLPLHVESIIHIDAATPEAVREWIGDDDFAAYLTSCNPYSQTLTDRQNDERLADLRQRMHAEGARFLEGIASAPDESWAEPSLLVAGISLADIDALACLYGQNAVVIVPARGLACLRVYRAAWHEAVADQGHPHDD